MNPRTLQNRNQKQGLVNQLTDTLASAFGKKASALEDVSEQFSNTKANSVIKLVAASQTLFLFVVTKKAVYPRDLRQAIDVFNECLENESKGIDAVGLLAADFLSAGARKKLSSKGVAWFDMSGSFYLNFKNWIIDIQRTPLVSQKENYRIDLFTASRESIIHTLLTSPRKPFTVVELAKSAQTSVYTCSVTLQELERREWVNTIGAGPNKRRVLINPDALLDAWAERWTARKKQQSSWFTFVERPEQMLAYLADKINNSDIDYPWAFTGAAPANSLCPLLTSVEKVEIIIPKGLTEETSNKLGLKRAEKGGNITLIERTDTSLQHTADLGAGVFASPYILYMDLLNGRERNKELAQKLKKAYLEKDVR